MKDNREIPCDYPRCKREAARLGEEVESCDGSMCAVCNLCEKHWQKCVDYGQRCEDRDWNNIKQEGEDNKK